MPLPLVLAAGAALLGTIYAAVPEAGKDIAREEFERILIGEGDEYINSLIQTAFERVGLDVDPEQGLTPQALTDAINAGPLAGTGIELSNIFDREACKRDVMRIATNSAADAFGLHVSDKSADGLKAAVKAEITRRVMEQLGEGAGEYIDAAPELVELAKQLAAGVRAGLIDPAGNFIAPGLMMDDFHVKLRERQARYYAGHGRKWEPK